MPTLAALLLKLRGPFCFLWAPLVLTLGAPFRAGVYLDVRLPGEGNPNSFGARPVHLIITMIKWIRTSR